MIVLKTLSREFDIDPYKLRGLLRKWQVQTNEGRYRWNEKDVALRKLREKLTKHCAGQAGNTSG